MARRVSLKRLCLDAMLLAVSLLLSYIEAILPLNVWLPLPGFKLGLCNIVITLVFVMLSPADAGAVSLARIFIMGLLFGNVQSLSFSLCGGILSYAGLWLFARLSKNIFSMVGTSVGCAALHNVGQLFAAALWFGSGAAWAYLPVLLVAALIFGTVTGALLQIILPRLTRLNIKQ